jgi:hypothetical protein
MLRCGAMAEETMTKVFLRHLKDGKVKPRESLGDEKGRIMEF